MPFPVARIERIPLLGVGGDARSYPSVGRMAMNAGRASGRLAANVLHGRRSLVSADVFEARLKVCLQCPGGYFDPIPSRCRHQACACYLKLKARLATEVCPAGYWPAHGH